MDRNPNTPLSWEELHDPVDSVFEVSTSIGTPRLLVFFLWSRWVRPGSLCLPEGGSRKNRHTRPQRGARVRLAYWRGNMFSSKPAKGHVESKLDQRPQSPFPPWSGPTRPRVIEDSGTNTNPEQSGTHVCYVMSCVSPGQRMVECE